MIEQPLNDSPIAATGKEVQNRFAFVVLAVKVCAVIEKKLHYWDGISLGAGLCQVGQRCEVVVVALMNIGAVVQQELN